MSVFQLSQEQVNLFEEDGFVIVKDLFNPDETKLLYDISKADRALESEAASRLDSKGAFTRINLHNDLPDDIFSAVVRSERVVNAMEVLLGGEVYHYHHKMTIKDPFTGGAWEWHQDYGYWYGNGCLYPYMGSCMIAVDRATRENGCLQVLRGSHKMGRIEHGVTGDQTGADMERVEEAMMRLELVHCEMEPGTGVFFHCNTLHRSDQNRSPDPRWAFICCYNAARNDPYKDSGHPRYNYLEKLPDSEVVVVGRRQWAAMQTGLATV